MVRRQLCTETFFASCHVTEVHVMHPCVAIFEACFRFHTYDLLKRLRAENPM